MKRFQPLVDLIASCDPGAPASPAAYVARARPFAAHFSGELSSSPKARVLFMGQTGVGKSTELLQLETGMEQEYTVLAPPIDRSLNLRIVSWHEIYVFSALWSAEQLGLSGHIQCRELAAALGPPVTEITFPPAHLFTRTRGGPPEPRGTQRFLNDHPAVKQVIQKGPAQFWDLASAVFTLIQNERQKPAILLIDGLEKLTDDVSKELFYGGGQHIRGLPFRTVITAPLSLSFQTFFGEVEEHFLFTERLRAVSCSPDEPGFKFFEELATKRGAMEVMSDEIVGETISWAGGLPRQFLQLRSTAAHQALTDGLDRIEKESFTRARIRVADRWQYQLQPADYSALERDDTERTADERARLLRLGALIEYDKQDGFLRIGINPLVRPLMKREKQKAS